MTGEMESDTPIWTAEFAERWAHLRDAVVPEEES